MCDMCVQCNACDVCVMQNTNEKTKRVGERWREDTERWRETKELAIPFLLAPVIRFSSLS